MTPEQKKQFLNLACALSPENLSCDGELSRSAVKRKAASLRRQWKELEKESKRLSSRWVARCRKMRSGYEETMPVREDVESVQGARAHAT